MCVYETKERDNCFDEFDDVLKLLFFHLKNTFLCALLFNRRLPVCSLSVNFKFVSFLS